MSRQDLGERVAKRAAAFLREHFYDREKHIRSKDEGASLVTAADTGSEEIILRQIRKHFPSDAIVAEESGAHQGSTGMTWFVDPLDGTRNFALGIPIFGVSIAVVEDGLPRFGAIALPMVNELFIAERGSGTHLDGRKVFVSRAREFAQGPILFSYPSAVGDLVFGEKATVGNLVDQFKSVRIFGSAAWNLATIARGAADGYIGLNLASHDVAAGILLVEEAGGKATTLDGGPVWLKDPVSLLASNGVLHDSLREAISTHRH